MYFISKLKNTGKIWLKYGALAEGQLTFVTIKKVAQIKQIIQSVLVSTVQMGQPGTSLEGGSAFLNISNLLGSWEELKSIFSL